MLSLPSRVTKLNVFVNSCKHKITTIFIIFLIIGKNRPLVIVETGIKVLFGFGCSGNDYNLTPLVPFRENLQGEPLSKSGIEQKR
jgi:hypothetical protein